MLSRESGSGKSTLGRAITGTLSQHARVRGGSISLRGTDLLTLSGKQRRALRGQSIGYVPQDAQVSLDPLVPVGVQAGSALRVHQSLSKTERQRRVIELFGKVGLRHPERVYHQYPHELSGGMCQRVLIAAALSTTPSLVIADEPTSALDVTVQKTILDLIGDLSESERVAMLLVTHDLGVAAERADDLLVLDKGRIVEYAPSGEIVRSPRDEYTCTLIAASGIGWHASLQTRDRRERAEVTSESTPAIEVRSVTRTFTARKRRGSESVTALRDVTLAVPTGTTLGLVGESGSGKTTLARIIAGLERGDAGEVVLEGTARAAAASPSPALRRRQPLQVVYQNPFASLDPRQRISSIITESLTGHRIGGGRADHSTRTAELIDRVGLPRKVLQQLPSELSGGQRQRVAIARALAPEPRILLLDEPVSALDVTVQKQILDLLHELQRELTLTYLFISHDLSVIDTVSDEVQVLFRGELVEGGRTRDVLENPQTDYVRQLLDAVPGSSVTRVGGTSDIAPFPTPSTERLLK